MKERILLSTYVVKILNGTRNEQILSYFNGKDDFLNTFEAFANQIFQAVKAEPDAQSRVTLHLTLDKPATLDANKRIIYGYFSSGVSGEKFNIREIKTNETALKVEPDKHASFRDVFFYFYVPKGKSIGYLILQRKAKFGVKSILKKVINQYIRGVGYSDYFVEINNILHTKVYTKMMKEGNLKKVELIKRKIPTSIEEFYKRDGKDELVKGTLKTSFSTTTTLPVKWKEFVDGMFRKRKNDRIEILGGTFDEVEFELELNGKKKTFYVYNEKRIQPDVDVTANLNYENGEPTLESLITESDSLVKDTLEITK